MALELRKKIIGYLKDNPGIQYKAREIAEWLSQTYPVECNEKLEKSEALKTEVDLIQQLAAEIGANRPTWQAKHKGLKTTAGRPKRYYYSEKTEQTEIEEAETPTEKSSTQLKEVDLYPMLIDFLKVDQGIRASRIDEKRSSNKQGKDGNRWLYPDLVGLEDLSKDWNPELKKLNREYAANKTRLWSFEVKLKLNRSNIRQSYFQAVSNSSWANFGYLVASEIDSKTIKELRMLYGLHGIGIILLDTENPPESDIMIPARERNEIDWETCNRLTEENTDFKSFVTSVRHFYQTGDLN